MNEISRNDLLEMIIELFDDEDLDQEITLDTELEAIGFDSVSRLGILALFDTYSENKISPAELYKRVTISDIINLFER